MAMAHEFYTVFLHKIPVLATQKVPSNLQIHKYTGQRINIHGTYRQFNQLLTRDVSILRTYLGIGSATRPRDGSEGMIVRTQRRAQADGRSAPAH